MRLMIDLPLEFSEDTRRAEEHEVNLVSPS